MNYRQKYFKLTFDIFILSGYLEVFECFDYLLLTFTTFKNHKTQFQHV